MSGRQKLDAAELDRVLGGRGGERYSREGRVKLLAAAAADLLAGRMPSPEAGTFLAAGLVSWLAEGGDLVREYWKV